MHRSLIGLYHLSEIMRWIVGDIHGMLRCLQPLVERVNQLDAGAQFIFAGDYVNRGPQSKEVIDFLLDMTNARFIRGNHDDIFDMVINGTCYAEVATNNDRVAAFKWFMNFGLDETLLSYGVDPIDLNCLMDECSIADLDKLGMGIPQRHRDFIRNLPPIIEEDDIFVVHGKWDPDELAEAPSISAKIEKNSLLRHPLLWGRYETGQVGRLKAWRRTGFFGHTPVSHYESLMRSQQQTDRLQMLPIVGANMVLLDTAAALGLDGRLTAMCVETREFVQVDHFGRDVKPGKGA